MKNKVAVTVLGLILCQSAHASQVYMELSEAIAQRCEIQLSKGGEKIEYKNFGTQINTFRGMTRIIPAQDRYRMNSSESIELADTAQFPTVSNAYSNCLSMVLAKGVFMSEEEADRLLLKDGSYYWDLCYKHYDGQKGIYHEEKFLGYGEDGKPIVEVGPTLPGETVPRTEFTLVRRQLVEMGSDKYIDINSLDNKKHALNMGAIESSGMLHNEPSTAAEDRPQNFLSRLFKKLTDGNSMDGVEFRASCEVRRSPAQ